MTAVATYFAELVAVWGAGWNRFWFTPSRPTTLGLLRLLTGLLLLCYVLGYTSDVERLLSPAAIDTAAVTAGAVRFSLFDWCASPAAAQLQHWCAVGVAGIYALGWYSRVVAPAALIVFLSYVHRAPLVTSEFEPILVLLLLYSCLGPCGGAFSLDALLARRAGKPAAAPSFAAALSLRLIQLHTAWIVLMMGLSKFQGEAWLSGEAVWWLAARPESRLIDITTWLHSQELLYNAWTHSMVLFELTFPVLIWNRWARPLLLVSACALWVPLALAAGLVPLAATLLVAMASFTPADWLERGAHA